MIYIIDGHFINGEKWQEICHSLKELDHSIKAAGNNEAACVDRISKKNGETITEKALQRLYGDM